MGSVEHVARGIGDEALASNAPLVRALVVERLEMLWRTCQPYVDGSAGVRPDPRFVDSGIRILDRLMRLYRLDSPSAGVEKKLELGDRAAIVIEALDAMEAKK